MKDRMLGLHAVLALVALAAVSGAVKGTSTDRPDSSKTELAAAFAEAGPKPFLELKHGGVAGVSFSPDGKTLAAWSQDGTIRLYDLGVQGPAKTTLPERAANWAPSQATGAPDAAADGDCATAWASQEPDGGAEWLELTYAEPVLASSVRIRETFNPGAVTRILLFGVDGSSEGEIAVDDTTRVSPGWLEVAFPATARPIRSVRVLLDTSKVPGWNEIDAVELLGNGKRQWASGARASSYYH